MDAIETPNYEINGTELVLEQAGTATFHFQLSRPTNGWPPGHYKMDLFIDGKPAGSAPFAVATAALPGSSSQLPDSKPSLAAGPFDLGPVQSDPKRLWTIAVYMGADNDLDPFALKDLQEMARGLPVEGVECIVLVDRARGPHNPGRRPDRPGGENTKADRQGLRLDSARPTWRGRTRLTPQCCNTFSPQSSKPSQLDNTP